MSRLTRGSRWLLPVRGCHPLWPTVPDRSGSTTMTTGLVRFRSPLLAESRLMSFPPANEMFQFAGFAPLTYVFSQQSPKRVGLPHSEIHGSKGARPSPRLFAACHVLHRLSVPRHPPDALRCSPLPAAFRSVPRPSSPLSAKASTRCPYLTLDRKEPHAQGQAPHATPLKTLMRNHDRALLRLAPNQRSRLRPRSHKNLFTMTINTGALFVRHRTRDLP